MRYLTLVEVLALHERVIRQTGGADGLRSLERLEGAVAQPRATYAGQDLYADVVSKAAALGYSLIQGHPFVDGNKRVGHAATETFLILNGSSLVADVDEQERVILSVAAGEMNRADLDWLRTRTAAV
jgi:death-on-curing protein